ncbi:hypothetical protein CBR_g50935 [Chara braunii]|uniref:Uncharacterized protein n=1 Tax=Chara braunii TaxID=69332 RepID=A0A388M7P6_CHABU|nr:hypothetical protein CBR_g50935 [Chara braunii]|eukprot:GBG90591.1 hypothetical protein CBR_g50935 [Chara braunii]
MLTGLRRSELTGIHTEMAGIIATASMEPVNEQDLMSALDELRQRATLLTLPALRESANREKISWLIRGDRMNAAFFRGHTRKNSSSLMLSMRHPWDADQPVAMDTAAIVQNVALLCKTWPYCAKRGNGASQAQHTEQKLLHDFADTVGAAIGPKLSPSQAQKLDRRIEMEEVRQALTALPPHKVPGQDGLPLLFFTKYQMRLLPELTVVLQSIFDGATPPAEMVTGMVSFIYKKGDRADVRNWRPITGPETKWEGPPCVPGGVLEGSHPLDLVDIAELSNQEGGETDSAYDSCGSEIFDQTDGGHRLVHESAEQGICTETPEAVSAALAKVPGFVSHSG